MFHFYARVDYTDYCNGLNMAIDEYLGTSGNARDVSILLRKAITGYPLKAVATAERVTTGQAWVCLHRVCNYLVCSNTVKYGAEGWSLTLWHRQHDKARSTYASRLNDMRALGVQYTANPVIRDEEWELDITYYPYTTDLVRLLMERKGSDVFPACSLSHFVQLVLSKSILDFTGVDESVYQKMLKEMAFDGVLVPRGALPII